MSDLYTNPYYRRELEAEYIQQAIDKVFGLLFYELQRLKDNQYILRADERSIAEWEKGFTIIPAPSESLEFRRQRLLNRNTTKPPYTMDYLESRLDALLGAGNYLCYQEGMTLYVESSVSNAQWFTEITVTVNRMKPAAVVYVLSPYLVKTVLVAEEISLSQRIYNYWLGTAWVLGSKPFSHQGEPEQIKTKEVMSLQPVFFSALAALGAQDIAGVRLTGPSGGVVIDEFITKEGIGNIATIEYEVSPEQIQEITLIELLNGDEVVLDTATVYIPVADTVQIKHRITMKEGVVNA